MLLTESFEAGDLVDVLEPSIGIDTYQSQIGTDADIIVLSFTVHDKKAAKDIVNFIERGYDFALDAEISPSEVSPGTYLVFVELSRRMIAMKQIELILSDFSCSAKKELKDWKFSYGKDKQTYPVTKQELRKIVPLSPHAYRKIHGE